MNKQQNAKIKFHFFVCSFCRVVQVAKTKKCNFISSFLRFVALYKSTKRRNEKTKKWNFISSFVRFVALYKSPNEEMEFHFFVSSFCTSRQNEETRKRRNGISFLRLFVLSRCTSRQKEEMDFISSFLRFVLLFNAPKQTNTKMKYQNFISSFVRFVALYKSPKRRNGFHFFVSSFCRVGQSTTKRQNDKVTAKYQSLIFRGYLFVLSFIRFVDFHNLHALLPKRQNDNATK